VASHPPVRRNGAPPVTFRRNSMDMSEPNDFGSARPATPAELRAIAEAFPPRTLGALALSGFQALDLWGPLEVFGDCRPAIHPVLVGVDTSPVPAAQGPRVVPDFSLETAPRLDLLLVPGGDIRQHAGDLELRQWLRQRADDAELVMTVCNGADLLAGTGLLDGRRATTTKASFGSIAAAHPGVRWVSRARWVEDGKFVTSSGVAAGIDMALSVVARMAGERVAAGLANHLEYPRHLDSGFDPFARIHGLE
jgi:transcriptional regulator GlxA family with amidase domain